MKQLKIVTFTFIAVAFAFVSIVFNSCDKKAIKYNDTTLIRPCDNVVCLNGASCVDGVCVCPKGYEGNKCEIKWSAKFTGNYQASDACYTGATGFYNVGITPDPNYAYKIRFYNLGTFCPAMVINADIDPERTTFQFPMQNTCGNLYLSGYGNINGDFINIYLKSRDTVLHSSDQCSIVLTKMP